MIKRPAINDFGDNKISLKEWIKMTKIEITTVKKGYNQRA